MPAAELVIEGVPATFPALYIEEISAQSTSVSTSRSPAATQALTDEEKQEILLEVDLQQQEFGIQR